MKFFIDHLFTNKNNKTRWVKLSKTSVRVIFGRKSYRGQEKSSLKTNFTQRINKINLSFILLLLLLLQSCATKHAQFGENFKKEIATQNAADTSKIIHTFYLVGDAGNADDTKAKRTLELLQNKIEKTDKNSTLLFLGDNIYPKGLPDKDKTKERALAETKLNSQLIVSEKFKGKTIFIAGNHDWDSGIEGLKRQSKYVTDYLKDKKAFLPANNCGIEELKINETITLIAIDSQWFLEDWDKTPSINDNCTIKTRDNFFEELETLLSLNKEKTVILALHHPLMSNGIHGGQFSVEKQLFPF
ncbi:MAG: metallophosphoesterase, partial [Flavobacterium sp.]